MNSSDFITHTATNSLATSFVIYSSSDEATRNENSIKTKGE